MSERSPSDIEADERELHLLLGLARPAALPIGFRDRVMAKVRGGRRVTWEWLVAALLAVPSLAFLARQILVHGEDFARALGNVVSATSTESGDAFFFVDGLTVVALALFGIACAFAAHALFVAGTRPRVAR